MPVAAKLIAVRHYLVPELAGCEVEDDEPKDGRAST